MAGFTSVALLLVAVARVFRRGGVLAIGEQTLASKEASYNFSAARRARINEKREEFSLV
jgi:hypothetical protein